MKLSFTANEVFQGALTMILIAHAEEQNKLYQADAQYVKHDTLKLIPKGKVRLDIAGFAP